MRTNRINNITLFVKQKHSELDFDVEEYQTWHNQALEMKETL
jgi:hypothetical protein